MIFDSTESPYFSCVVNRHENKWRSIPKAPFGGIVYHQDHETDSELVTNTIRNIAFDQGIDEISIISSAEIYLNTLFLKNVRPKYIDVNNHLNLSVDYWDRLHKMERRKLNRCISEGLVFRHLKHDQAQQVYHFIKECRQKKNVDINISEYNFLKTLDTFPKHYQLFGIFHNDKLIAATVAVKVNQQVVYNYLPASDILFNHLSPMVFLIKELHHYYQQRQYQIIDLGISSIKGVTQEGLLKFKTRIGAFSTEKPTYNWVIH